MLSIIVCSRNKMLSTAFIDNIKNTVGVDYEIISIDNSANQYSIFSAYNTGFAKSKFPYVCFVHEDVLFHTQNWGEIVIQHLQSPGTGILGLAGGDLATRVPASWSTLMSCVNIIQSDRNRRKESKQIIHPENFKDSKRSVILLDGVLMCMTSELMKKIHFDEQFNGFHGYDFDISIQSTLAGYTNYVLYDIKLEHFSRGKTDDVYYRNLISVFKKWENSLPLIGKNVTEDQRSHIPDIEKKRLLKLVSKMARKGFSTKEIIAESTYFANIINDTEIIHKIKSRIFFIRLFNCPIYIFK
ncbi:MAG: glycosyltransferase [Paludibacter sp.]|nr:glycosyltransferase [Paludibacter sp.]